MCSPATLETVQRNLENRRGFCSSLAAATAAIAMPPLPAQAGDSGRPRYVVDLTHPLTSDFPTYRGDSTFALSSVADFVESSWNHRRWEVFEHTGTHLDAPIHRSSDGATADQIDPSEFLLPLVVLDIKDRAAHQPDAVITPEDVHRWKNEHGPVPRGACVAMNSGWAAHVRTPRFRGADDEGTLHFPGFHDETAALLLDQRDVLALAVDTLSIDIGPSREFPVHTRWLPAGRWALECLANLDDVPPHGAQLFVGIPKVAGATGGPCRVLAWS